MLTHNELKVTRSTVSLKRYPKNASPLTVVHLSDLHFYEYSSPEFYQRVAETINALTPDLILMTGDVVHYGDTHLQMAQEFLGALEARLGRFAVAGNHDFYDFAESAAVAAMIEATGFTILRNAAVPIHLHPDNAQHNAQLWLAGLDDLWCGKPNIDKAVAAIDDPDACLLMMAHNPLLFDPVSYYPLRRIDALFSGHTHAGHVFIPILEPIYRHVFKMKYRYHWHEKAHPVFPDHRTKLYVTSGVGSAAFYLKKWRIGFPRFRFNTYPEIACIEVGSETAIAASVK